DHFGVVFNDGETIVGGARVMRKVFAPGHCFYYVPEGPVFSQDENDITEVFEHVMAFIESKRSQDALRVSHLRIEPRWEHLPACAGAFRRSTGWDEPRNTLCIDLSPPESAILAQMKPKGRYNIGVARRLGVRIVEDTSAQGLRDFLRIYEETVSRQGIKAKPASYFEKLLCILSSVQKG